ncbi:ABC transporter permease [Spiroplasma helicoides]|uniref:ABC transporter permease n=1 Tax=Spiroplasma helicoides TaxID=216938 RepID=A0A1B3SM80_9MOLU|nr:ABC transporter permease [Spiroplasma helicoides]AOG61035.1 ABC transporter permease [Spiroplasma helicoides]
MKNKEKLENELFIKKNNFLAVFGKLYMLIQKSYFKNVRGPLFTYVVPIFFTVMLYLLFKDTFNKGNPASALLGYFALPSLWVIVSLSSTIVEWKNSIFLKRVETTGINKPLFITTIALFYFMVTWTGVIVELIVGFSLDSEHAKILYKEMNWGYFFLAVCMLILVAISIGILLGGLMNDEGLSQGVSLIIYFICMFFSGIMLDPRLYEGTEGLRIFTYFVPLKYPVAILLFSQYQKGSWDTAGFNIGRWDERETPLFKDFTQTWQPVLGSILIISTLFTLGIFMFRWHKSR